MNVRTDNPLGKRYRIVVRYRQWVGKPDPSGFGTYTLSSDDPAYLRDEVGKLNRSGHMVLATQAYRDGAWVTL